MAEIHGVGNGDGEIGSMSGGGTDQGFHANLRNAPTVLLLWDTTTVQAFAAWDLKLRTNIDLRTFEGFIVSTRPNLEEARRMTRISGGVRLADIQASIDLWDKHDGFLFTRSSSLMGRPTVSGSS